MVLEHVGNCVKIAGVMIHAMNIQVANVPGFIDGQWYGVYFEVIFNTGALWVVSQGAEEDDRSNTIMITEYPKWAMTQNLEYPGVTLKVQTWEEFLGLYNEKLTVS